MNKGSIKKVGTEEEINVDVKYSSIFRKTGVLFVTSDG